MIYTGKASQGPINHNCQVFQCQKFLLKCSTLDFRAMYQRQNQTLKTKKIEWKNENFQVEANFFYLCELWLLHSIQSDGPVEVGHEELFRVQPLDGGESRLAPGGPEPANVWRMLSNLISLKFPPSYVPNKKFASKQQSWERCFPSEIGTKKTLPAVLNFS